jgi:hypothetical protein
MALDHPSSPSVRFSGPLRDLADLDTAQNSGRIPRPVSTHSIEPTRAIAAETSNLERALSDLVNQAYSPTPAEIALTWQTASPRMPIPAP